jgi:acid stress-induced BolA-like protein IbaG/YrbA
MSPLEIQERIEASIAGAQAQVRDYTGTGDHFEVSVIASAFAGKSPVERHQMVYAALGADVDGRTIHALSLSTKTPEQAAQSH